MITRLITPLFAWLHRRTAQRRGPDVVIGEPDNVYLRRWWVIPRNRVFNLYLHEFSRSDDDRALHDHPWLFNLSVLLSGTYVEHTIDAGGIHRERTLRMGQSRFRFGGAPHRIELRDGPVWTLFITGPVVRHWGFHCPHGWVHWTDFTANGGATVGKGCGE